MEQSNKELMEEIADLFEDYEEPYVPGEWESFLKHKKKKYPFFPRWVKVAAILFLVVSVLPFNLKNLMQKKNAGAGIAKNQPAVSSMVKAKPVVPFGAQTGVTAVPVAAGKKLSVEKPLNERPVYVRAGQLAEAGRQRRKDRPVPDREQLVAGTEKEVVVQAKEQGIDQDKVQPVVQAKAGPVSAGHAVQDNAGNNQAAPDKRKISTSEFMLAETRKVVLQEKKKEAVKKWDFGVQVMPTATRSNMNFGAGLVTAYRISNKFSLSSGISILGLGSVENVPAAASSGINAMAAPAGFSSAEGGRQLRSVDADLRAIDIPLGLVYRVNKHYYTSAGISYFNVLSEKRNNTYSQIQPVSRTTTDPETGAVFAYKALESQQVDEPATDQPLKGNSYLGFFNFSIGRRQNIFKQYNIQIEPFIRVPIGKLSAQDLNLLNSGIKFQLSF